MVIDCDVLMLKFMQVGEKLMYGLMLNGMKGVQLFMLEWVLWLMVKCIVIVKDLLKQVGYLDVKLLLFMFMYNINDLYKKVVLFIVLEWCIKFGIIMKFENVEFKVLMKQWYDGKVQIVCDGWFVDYNDVMIFFDLICCGSLQNIVGYCNKQMDVFVDEGNQKFDDQVCIVLFMQVYDMVMKDMLMVLLFQYLVDCFVKFYVGGYLLKNVIDMCVLQDLYLIKY